MSKYIAIITADFGNDSIQYFLFDGSAKAKDFGSAVWDWCHEE